MPSDAFQFQGDDDLRFLRDELYEGSWELMLVDLQARLEMRPAVFKITENIREDIAAIKRLMAAEAGARSNPDERPAPKTASKGSKQTGETGETVETGEATASKAKPASARKKSRRQSTRKPGSNGNSSSSKKRGKSA
ncbi:MAG: hypothetical protein AB7K09_11590 [Planctomycetota bacterium]